MTETSKVRFLNSNIFFGYLDIGRWNCLENKRVSINKRRGAPPWAPLKAATEGRPYG